MDRFVVSMQSFKIDSEWFANVHPCIGFAWIWSKTLTFQITGFGPFSSYIAINSKAVHGLKLQHVQYQVVVLVRYFSIESATTWYLLNSPLAALQVILSSTAVECTGALKLKCTLKLNKVHYVYIQSITIAGYTIYNSIAPY